MAVKLSLVTVHLNDLNGLVKTSDSVKQLIKKADVEWVIIDGESKPSSFDEADLLRSIFALADKVVSEPDSGIYDAMNKGTRLARGDYILFLNAGDQLHQDFELDRFVATCSDRPDMVWGQCIEVYENGEELELKTRSPAWTWYAMPACHQSIFFSRNTLGQSPYDTRYQIAADYELVSRLVSGGGVVRLLAMNVAKYYRGGMSSKNSSLVTREYHLIRTSYFRVPKVLSILLDKGKTLLNLASKSARLRRIWRGKV